MTNTELKVKNPLNLFDGCRVKLRNGTIVQVFFDDARGVFVNNDGDFDWLKNGTPRFGLPSSPTSIISIISIAPTHREPVKVPEPWTIWRNFIRDDVYRGDWHTKEAAISNNDGHEYTLEIKCTVIAVHRDGTIQEVK